MKVNMKNFVKSMIAAQAYAEKGTFGFPVEHGLRVAFTSLKVARELNFSNEEVFDLVIIALFHDVGISLSEMSDIVVNNKYGINSILITSKEHCIFGEEVIECIPFMTNPKNILLYHHEHADGSGLFGITGSDIPIMSQIIYLLGILDHVYNFELASNNNNIKEKMLRYVIENTDKLFLPKLVGAFLKVYSDGLFWDMLSNKVIFEEIDKELDDYVINIGYDRIRDLSSIFSTIIDLKSVFTSEHSSGLSTKMRRMIEYYHINEFHGIKLLIAADLHDLGKIAISNDILDKKGELTSAEFEEVKKHPTIAWECLRYFDEFQDLSEWIYNHHERLNGTGYPRGLSGKEIDFNSRLLSCLDIFQALGEKRPYRDLYSKDKAFEILNDMANDNLIDKNICEDIIKVFKDELKKSKD
ncbi:HD domain-containing phosphohydrolase [Mycoplasmatota bacterium WC30]